MYDNSQIMDMVLGRRLEHEDEMRREKEQLKQEEQKRIKDSQEQRVDSHRGSKIMQQLARDQDDQPQASKPRSAVGKQNVSYCKLIISTRYYF